MKEVADERVQLRVVLDGPDGNVVRDLVVPMNFPLERLHIVLQVAFGWQNCHLHHFVRGLEPYSRTETVYGTGFDGSATASEHGVPFRVLIHSPGDVATYEYDFGDGWTHRITVVDAVSTPPTTLRLVECVGGSGSGRPEDSRGTDLPKESLIPFDRNAIQERLDAAARHDFRNVPGALSLHLPRELLALERYAPTDEDFLIEALAERAELEQSNEVTSGAAANAVLRFSYVISRARNGIILTNAGYLPPKEVVTWLDDLGLEREPASANNREEMVRSVAELRELAQELGLLRKAKGALTATQRAQKLHRDPVAFWQHLTVTVPYGKSDFERAVSYLVLLTAAAGMAWARPLQDASDEDYGSEYALRILRRQFHHSDGSPMKPEDLYHVGREVRALLRYLGGYQPVGQRRRDGLPNDVGRRFARAALYQAALREDQ